MNEGAQRIAAAARRWRRRRLALAAVKVTALTLPWLVGAATAITFYAPTVAALISMAGLAASLWAWRRWRPAPIDASVMARHLDRTRPELEESSELLLETVADLPLLGRLQRERIGQRLGAAESHLEPPKWGRALAGLAVSLLAALLIPRAGEWAVAVSASRGTGSPSSAPGSARVQEPPAVATVETRIVPPAYTGRPERTIQGLDLEAEAGAEITWRVELEGAVADAFLIFDESEVVVLAPGGGGSFTAALRATETRLYRLELAAADGRVVRGGYARLEVIPDAPPEFSIVAPARFVELEGRRGQQIDIVVEARDDYGLGPASLVATVASGFGELVEFRERRLTFDRREDRLPEDKAAEDRSGEQPATTMRRYSSRIDLDALGVAPGSEFFFFAEGEDRARPEPHSGRSATHIVRVAGDSTRSVGLSSRLPILRVPEFFRSQRQIILDTERLLGEEAVITAAEFRRRSESLGLDQRALRQRYGGLLGEEFDAGRSGAPGLDEEAREEDGELRRLDEMESGKGGGREDVREALETLTQGLAHQHDSADSSTFFDSEIKAQLKAALEEMWGAEGKLRGVDPRRALPFEYRALTLLKEVQQRSRLYVQKIGFEAPELYPEENRLTGDLSKIRDLRRQSSARLSEELAGVRLALAVLSGSAQIEQSRILAAAHDAARQMAERARRDPGLELTGLENLRLWISSLEQETEAAPEVTAGAVAALWSLLPVPEAVPVVPGGNATELGASYRRRLSAGASP